MANEEVTREEIAAALAAYCRVALHASQNYSTVTSVDHELAIRAAILAASQSRPTKGAAISEEELAQIIDKARDGFHRDGPAASMHDLWSRKAARAILARFASEAAPSASGRGMVVPKQATREMSAAFEVAVQESWTSQSDEDDPLVHFQVGYSAMLASAPTHSPDNGWLAIIDAARDWLTERSPRDPTEKRLAVAIVRAFPEELQGKEYCTCGEQDECDECPTTAQVQEIAKQWERDISLPPPPAQGGN